MTDRSCGACYACCIYLGIKELKKPPTKYCTHLTGENGANTRCTIYNTRPLACSKYKCAYLNGFGTEDFRPDKVGLLITSYLDPTRPPQEFNTFLTTITITDEKKSGWPNLTSGNIKLAIDFITPYSTGDIRIVNYHRKEVIFFHQNKIYRGKLLKSTDLEELNFICNNNPIGHYHSEPLTLPGSV